MPRNTKGTWTKSDALDRSAPLVAPKKSKPKAKLDKIVLSPEAAEEMLTPKAKKVVAAAKSKAEQIASTVLDNMRAKK